MIHWTECKEVRSGHHILKRPCFDNPIRLQIVEQEDMYSREDSPLCVHVRDHQRVLRWKLRGSLLLTAWQCIDEVLFDVVSDNANSESLRLYILTEHASH